MIAALVTWLAKLGAGGLWLFAAFPAPLDAWAGNMVQWVFMSARASPGFVQF
nr:hypothetical protein [Marinicella sp. W31]MDC2877698.1 hypothetical protein [Marinicella sp. W31]